MFHMFISQSKNIHWEHYEKFPTRVEQLHAGIKIVPTFQMEMIYEPAGLGFW